MLIYESIRLYNLSKQNLVVRYSEEKRREFFATRYLKIASVSLILCVAACLALSLLLSQKHCREK